MTDRTKNSKHWIQAVLALMVGLATGGAGASALLPLGDLNGRAAKGEHGEMVGYLGGVVYAFSDGVHGEELWVSDGTELGTHLLADIAPGVGSGSAPDDFTTCYLYVYFTADDGASGRELWRTDGTTEGTELVADLEPADGVGGEPDHLVCSGSDLYFSASSPATGRELWLVDSKTKELTFVADMAPGPEDAFITETAVLGGRLWFAVRDGGESGYADSLWNYSKYDGFPVKVTSTEYGAPEKIHDLTSGNGEIWFSAKTDETGYELWRASTIYSPDTTGVEFELSPGSDNSSPDSIVAVGAHVYFSAKHPNYGRELFIYSGGEVGLVADIAPGTESSDPARVTVMYNKILFTAEAPGTGQEVYSTPMGGIGATKLAEIGPGEEQSLITGITSAGPVAYFTARDADSGWEPWRTDGTVQGTYRLADIEPGSDYSLSSSFACPFYGSGEIFFLADREDTGRELWYSDGTTEGTRLVVDANPSTYGSNAYDSIVLHDQVLFVARGTGIGQELFVTDGTVAGTKLLKDINPGTYGSFPRQLTRVGDVVFLMASDGVHGTELWRTDGTTAGTWMVKDIGPVDTFPDWFRSAGDLLIFSADDGINGRELWVSDGTSEGTHLLYGGGVEALDGNPVYMVEHDGLVYGTIESPLGGRVIFRTDGTYEGTGTVGDPASGFMWDTIGRLAPLPNGLLAFVESPFGREPHLLAYDGSSIQLLANIGFGAATSGTDSVVSCGDYACFTATAPDSGKEVWCTDGTQAGTQLMADIMPGIDGSDPDELTCDGTYVWFTADNGVHGVELYRTAGTPETTHFIADIAPGAESGDPRSLFAGSAGLYYSAYRPDVGREVFVTAGEDAVTLVAADLLEGPAGGSQADLSSFFTLAFAELNGDLFFSGSTATGGAEPHMLCQACALGGACLADGEPDSENPCRACDEENPTEWAETGNDSACDDGMACTFDFCNGTQGCFYGINDEIAACQLSLFSVTPGVVEPGAPKLFLLEGQGFTEQTTVVWPEAAIVTVDFVDANTLLAQIVTPEEAGQYDVGVYTDEVEGGWYAYLTNVVEVAGEPGCKGVACLDGCTDDSACVDFDPCTDDVCLGGECLHELSGQCCADAASCGVCEIAGDLSGDGSVSIVDGQCAILTALWMTTGKPGLPPSCLNAPVLAADLDCDNEVNVGDLILIIQMVLENPLSPAVDADQDGCHDSCQQL